MKTYLIDASVVLKSILKEDNSIAKKIGVILEGVMKGSVEVISSNFLILEVANGIRFREKDAISAKKYLEAFLKLPIKYLFCSREQYKKALEVSYDIGTTVYDTSYHVLAKAQNAVFLTCDEDYFSKAKGLGDIELVI